MFQTTAFVGGQAVSIEPIQVHGHQRPEVRNALQLTNLEAAYSFGMRLWEAYGFNPEQLGSVLRDGLNSDLVYGPTPEQWSPLSAPDAASLGRLNADEAILDEITGSPYRLRAMDALLPDGSAWVTLEEEGNPRAAIAFGADAFIALVPEGAERLVVTSSAAEPWERESEFLMRQELGSLLRGRIEKHLIWRLYLGQNTGRFDGSARERRGIHRVLLNGTRTTGLLVGRLLYAIPLRSDRVRTDPLAWRRVTLAESRDRATATRCPQIERAQRAVGGGTGRLVVAIHGTMSTAVPLAAAIRRNVPEQTDVVRFEHDTWTSIVTNAEALYNEVRRLGSDPVLFIAHSRGGLVGRHAAHLLSVQGVAASLLTLGSPFAGTPVVEGVRNGLLGVRALLGGLRALDAANPVVDPATRLLGWMIRGSLPDGLAQMAPGSDYLRMLRAFRVPQGKAFAGVVGDDFDTDAYGLEFLRGFAGQAFGPDPNDLVVAASSAGGGFTSPEAVDCDHFSYLLDDQVLRGIRQTVGALGGRPGRLFTEDSPQRPESGFLAF